MLLKLLICQIIACRSAPKEDTTFQKIGLIHLGSFLTHPISRTAQASSSLTDLSVYVECWCYFLAALMLLLMQLLEVMG